MQLPLLHGNLQLVMIKFQFEKFKFLVPTEVFPDVKVAIVH